MKKLANIYFTCVTQTTESTFSLSPRHIALWQSQMEDHTSDLLRVVLIFRLGQTINGDIYGDHVVSCAGIIGIKHRHNVVCDTLVDICFRSAISAGKEVDIGLGGGCGKPLRPADMLLYSWDVGLDVCVDLTGSSLLTQTVMVDFVLGRAVIDTAHRKQVKYEAKCADIGYGFLPFSFSSLGELKKDAVTLLKRIRKFSMTQDIGARAAVHIFNKISFAIAKGGVEIPKFVDTTTPKYKPKFDELLVELKEAEQKSLKESERLEKEIADVQELKKKLSTMTADEYFEKHPELKKKFDDEIRNDYWGY
ncbi:putative reverse transcriptase domain-containing protein [Tanacetum coccineum]